MRYLIKDLTKDFRGYLILMKFSLEIPLTLDTIHSRASKIEVNNY